MKLYREWERRAMKYFQKYPNYNAFIHVLGGIGLGFLLAYPVTKAHPVRWGVAFLLISLAGHWWAGRKNR